MNWMPAEDRILKEIFAADLPAVARVQRYEKELPDRTLAAIRYRIGQLELHPTRPRLATRLWTAEDIATLKQHWESKTSIELAEMLNRSPDAINEFAKKIGLPRKRLWAKVTATPQMDNAIRAAYNSAKRGACKAVSAHYGVPVGWVKYRARLLGLTRSLSTHKVPWTPEEDALIEEYHERGGARYVANRLKKAGYLRSVAAIEIRVRHLGLSWKNRDIYNASELATVMGVDSKTITNWIKFGYLKAHKENASGLRQADEPYHWLIAHADARKFLIEHVARYRLAMCDRYWIVATLADRSNCAGSKNVWERRRKRV